MSENLKKKTGKKKKVSDKNESRQTSEFNNENSEHSTTFYLHATALVGSRLLGKVLRFYNGIFGIEPEDKAKIHRHMGSQYLKKGNYTKAVNSLRDWARLEPGNVEALFELAKAMKAANKTKPAINVYSKILEIDPNNVDALYSKTRLFFKRKDFEKALENFPKLEKLASDNPDVLYLMAMSYSRLDKTQEAITVLKKAIEVDEDEIRYYQNLGFLYERTGKNDEAAKCFSRVMELEDEQYDD